MGGTSGIEIDGYEIVERLGEGGMGTVYRARQLDFDREVAIKLIHPHLANNRSFEERFRSEMRIAISLHHPHIVPVYAAGESDGSLFISMGLVPGENLDELIERQGPIDPPEAVALVRQIASALDEAHRRQVIHRDVKPGNVLIDNRVSHAYLTDFGLARSLDASQHLTGTGQVALTIPYAAPEQIEGKPVDGRADVYALGCLLFAAVTGESAFQGESAPSVIWAKMNGNRTPRLGARGLPGPLDPVIDRALHIDPASRYGSPGEFAEAASQALLTVGQPLPPPPPPPALARTDVIDRGTPPPPPPPPARRLPTHRDAPTTVAPEPAGMSWFRKTVIVLGVVALFAVGAAAAVLALGGSNDSPTETIAQTSEPSEATDQTTTVTAEAVEEPEQDSSQPDKPHRDRNVSDAGAADVMSFSGERFTAEIPDGWIAEKVDADDGGGRIVSVWRNPTDDNTSVLIDTGPPANAPPIDSVTKSQEAYVGVASHQDISSRELTINGLSAAEWIFDNTDAGDRRVDYFFDSCDKGFAVLGSTSPEDFAKWEPTFRRVAESVSPYCE